MDSSSSRSLAFLLSLGGVPLACVGGSGETDTASSDATTGSGTTTGSAGTESTGTMTGTSGTDSDGMTTSSSTTGETSVGESTGETSGTTGEPADGCEAWAEKYVECYPREALREVLSYCQMTQADLGDNLGAGCASAFGALYACLAGATCEQIENEDYYTICPEAYAAVDEACALVVGETCAAFAEKYAECFEELPGIDLSCEEILNESYQISMACGEAREELFVCLNGLDCASFENDIGCEAEGEALELACE